RLQHLSTAGRGGACARCPDPRAFRPARPDDGAEGGPGPGGADSARDPGGGRCRSLDDDRGAARDARGPAPLSRMSTQTGRTFVGSVLSIDLVGYSMRSVSEQESVKQRFNRLLQKALLAASDKGRTILDTGDGALITFLGDPEQCFMVGLRVRDVMNAAAQDLGCAPGTYPVRLGIHLGSVKQSVGLSGNPSIVGDGVNVAERIVGFAEPGQIVVSRAFYDVVSRLSDAHARLLVPLGTRTDKNGREHEIFVVSPQAVNPSSASTRTVSATVSFKPRTVAL